MPDLTYTGPLWIPGHPVSKGSMRCVTPHVGGRRGILKPQKADQDPWEGKVAAITALRQPALVQAPIQGAVELVTDFYLPRPKTTKYPDAPIGHGLGDLDKLIRCVGDALTLSGVYRDDALVTRVVAEKHYAARPDGQGVSIELRPYTPVSTAWRDGQLGVRVQAGRINALVGAISSLEDLPKVLRAAADEIERRGVR